MANLAVLGTGLIGAGMVEAACRRGDVVTVWNRTIEKARALEAFGARSAGDPAEAVRGAERVHLALSDDAAVDAVLGRIEGALGKAVVVDHTTASPAGTARRHAHLTEAGIAFLHAPVFMSPANARDAKGIMLVSGLRPVFERVEAELAAMTGKVLYMGDRPDLAAANKLFGNALIISIVGGLADVLAMAKELGIEPTAALSLFDHFSPVGVLAYRGRNMAAGDYRASFELSMARKDVRLMLEAAGDATLAVLPAIAARMDALLAAGHARDDMGILAVESVPPRRDA